MNNSTVQIQKIEGKHVIGQIYFADGRKGKGSIAVNVLKRQDGKSFFYDIIRNSGAPAIISSFVELKAKYKVLRESDITEQDILKEIA